MRSCPPPRRAARPGPSRDTTVDEPRVPGRARLRAESEALGDAGPESLDEGVGALDETEYRLDAVGVLEIDGDARPAAVSSWCSGAMPMPSPESTRRSTRTTSAPSSARSIAHIGHGPMPASSMTLQSLKRTHAADLRCIGSQGARDGSGATTPWPDAPRAARPPPRQGRHGLRCRPGHAPSRKVASPLPVRTSIGRAPTAIAALDVPRCIADERHALQGDVQPLGDLVQHPGRGLKHSQSSLGRQGQMKMASMVPPYSASRRCISSWIRLRSSKVK